MKAVDEEEETQKLNANKITGCNRLDTAQHKTDALNLDMNWLCALRRFNSNR